eukprot:COSAG02_NODE_27214_length_614_cov_4.966990_1_plen_126_part_10
MPARGVHANQPGICRAGDVIVSGAGKYLFLWDPILCLQQVVDDFPGCASGTTTGLDGFGGQGLFARCAIKSGLQLMYFGETIGADELRRRYPHECMHARAGHVERASDRAIEWQIAIGLGGSWPAR